VFQASAALLQTAGTLHVVCRAAHHLLECFQALLYLLPLPLLLLLHRQYDWTIWASSAAHGLP
jgi:hypothetical protein